MTGFTAPTLLRGRCTVCGIALELREVAYCKDCRARYPKPQQKRAARLRRLNRPKRIAAQRRYSATDKSKKRKRAQMAAIRAKDPAGWNKFMRDYRQNRDGKCIDCVADAVPGKKRCQLHLDAARSYKRTWRSKRAQPTLSAG